MMDVKEIEEFVREHGGVILKNVLDDRFQHHGGIMTYDQEIAKSDDLVVRPLYRGKVRGASPTVIISRSVFEREPEEEEGNNAVPVLEPEEEEGNNMREVLGEPSTSDSPEQRLEPAVLPGISVVEPGIGDLPPPARRVSTRIHQ